MNMTTHEANERRTMMQQHLEQLQPLMSLPPANWEELQQAVRVNVAEAMEDFYRRHARALRKLELIIETELLPKLKGIPPDGRASKETRRTAELVKRLLCRVARLRPVIMVRMPVQDKRSCGTSSTSATAATAANLMYKIRRRAGRTASGATMPLIEPRWPRKCPQNLHHIGHTLLRPSHEPRYTIWQRQNQRGRNMAFKKSSYTTPLNRHKDFPPILDTATGRRWRAIHTTTTPSIFYD